MKANAIGVEFEILLNDEEISRLEKEALTGKVRQRISEKVRFVDLKVELGKIGPQELDVELKFKGNIWKTRSYQVVMSQEGLTHLRTSGIAGNRMAYNPGCKVLVLNELYELQGR